MDIVERLRMPTAYGDDQRKEAADEIERLRTALKPFADLCDQLSCNHLNGGPDDENVYIQIGWVREARRALEPKP